MNQNQNAAITAPSIEPIATCSKVWSWRYLRERRRASMPANEWLVVLKSFIWLSRRLARKKDVRSRDGDAPRALIVMSRNRFSTATLDHALKSYPGAPGTICALTNTKIIGSDIAHAASRSSSSAAAVNTRKAGVGQAGFGQMMSSRLVGTALIKADLGDADLLPLVDADLLPT